MTQSQVSIESNRYKTYRISASHYCTIYTFGDGILF